MTSLPIDAAIPEIIALVRDRRRLVLVAEPGAGKTTRVPPALLAADLLDPSHPTLILLQPRRVAARASAARIAEEQEWALGGPVGYQIRFEKRAGPATRLLVVTEGILGAPGTLRWLAGTSGACTRTWPWPCSARCAMPSAPT